MFLLSLSETEIWQDFHIRNRWVLNETSNHSSDSVCHVPNIHEHGQLHVHNEIRVCLVATKCIEDFKLISAKVTSTKQGLLTFYFGFVILKSSRTNFHINFACLKSRWHGEVGWRFKYPLFDFLKDKFIVKNEIKPTSQLFSSKELHDVEDKKMMWHVVYGTHIMIQSHQNKLLN